MIKFAQRLNEWFKRVESGNNSQFPLMSSVDVSSEEMNLNKSFNAFDRLHLFKIRLCYLLIPTGILLSSLKRPDSIL